MASHYTKTADRSALAKAAMDKLKNKAVEPVSVSAANSRRETVSQRQRRGGDFGATTAGSER
jgi:hypothetical protein